jgi:hypothetical protein
VEILFAVLVLLVKSVFTVLVLLVESVFTIFVLLVESVFTVLVVLVESVFTILVLLVESVYSFGTPGMIKSETAVRKPKTMTCLKVCHDSHVFNHLILNLP